MNKNSKYSIKYNKTNVVRVALNLNKKTDQDLIDLLNSVPNKQGLIKEVLRDYINKDR